MFQSGNAGVFVYKKLRTMNKMVGSDGNDAEFARTVTIVLWCDYISFVTGRSTWTTYGAELP